mmetsp:Transcript_33637/g.46586  ORF Transcript_33637/g.46586 Transcript_33637/m.46586 type:complete len:106 (+) Transcript_33637:3-320(+)
MYPGFHHVQGTQRVVKLLSTLKLMDKAWKVPDDMSATKALCKLSLTVCRQMIQSDPRVRVALKVVEEELAIERKAKYATERFKQREKEKAEEEKKARLSRRSRSG